MVQVEISILHQTIVDMLLSQSKTGRSISDIIKTLEEIRDRGHNAINPDDARRLEYIAVEFIRMSRDMQNCCH